ncbi:hypothetical protein GCM10029992_32150 [Glycomyces albus]
MVDAFLLGGINKVTVHGENGLAVDRLSVGSTGDLASAMYEAEDGTAAGTAQVEDLSLASGGRAVVGIGGEPGNGNTLTFANVEAPESGRYAVTFRYSNEEQSPATHYNPDPVARYALVSVNGGEPVRVAFPHSFHENNFWELTVPFDLAEGPTRLSYAARRNRSSTASVTPPTSGRTSCCDRSTRPTSTGSPSRRCSATSRRTGCSPTISPTGTSATPAPTFGWTRMSAPPTTRVSGSSPGWPTPRTSGCRSSR